MFGFLFLSACRSVFFGGIPFWSDPARDLLAAWDSHRKITLIGQPGGLPGVFYLPYWIWLLSLILLFTKNPAVVAFFIATLPYFVIGFWLCRKFTSVFGAVATAALAGLFLVNYQPYYTFIWNPYPAPLIFFALAWLIYRWSQRSLFFAGICLALLAGFHLSFFTGVAVATGLLFAGYLLAGLVRRRPTAAFLKIYLSELGSLAAGAALVFVPFFVFEFRHGFCITRSYISAILNSALYNSAAVGQTGLSKAAIIDRITNIPSATFHLPLNLFPPLVLLMIAMLIFRRRLLGPDRQRLLFFLIFSLASLVGLFYASKNPVWDYYFIGIETIVLLLAGLLVGQFRYFSVALLCWAIILTASAAAPVAAEPVPKYFLAPTLVAKETVVKTVVVSAGPRPYTVAAYSPSIYSFDYDYLFRWLAPHRTSPGLVYLIIPPGTSPAVREDFIHYKTPDKDYRFGETKTMPDNTEIIQRLKN